MKNLYLPIFIILLLLNIFFSPSKLTAEERTLPEKKQHIVVKGDTLWDICKTYYNNPFLWPKLWAKNPHISNPHLIYPGDRIELYPEEELIAEVKKEKITKKEEKSEQVPVKEEKAGVKREEKVEIPRGEIKEEEEGKYYYYSMIASCGFVMDEKPAYFARIAGDGSVKEIFGEGDTLYADLLEEKEFRSGSRFSIVRVERKIVHPVKGRFSGYLISILGQAELIELRGNTGKIRVLESFSPIRKGDGLITYLHLDPKIQIKESTGKISGYIIDNKNGLDLLGEGDVVYIDIGSRDGIDRGSVFSIVKEERIRSGGNVRVVERSVGKALVILSMEKASTALIIQSEEPLRVGMRVISIQQQ